LIIKPVLATNIVWFQKISIPSPRRVIKNSEREQGGCLTPNILKESMKLNWSFQRGVGVQTKKTAMSMDIV